MTNARKVTSLGEKFMTVVMVVLVLATAFVAFEFAGFL